MKSRLIPLVCLFIILQAAIAVTAENDTSGAVKERLRPIAQKELGNLKILRMEEPEDSPIKGLKQVRIWFESVYGETPVLFYMTDDAQNFIAGSIFDAEGKNLTKLTTGTTKLRTVDNSEMSLRDEYRFGLQDAAVHIVLWMGTDRVSLKIFDALFDIFTDNPGSVALSIKFYPTNKQNPMLDLNRAQVLSCFTNEKFIEGIRFLQGTSPQWGERRADIDALKVKRGFEDCTGDIVLEDMKLARKLNLPSYPTVFINGVIMLEDITKENIARISGYELK